VKISVDQLSAAYGATLVVKQVDLVVPGGGAMAILGRNGMGKTTLLRALLGYLPATKGRIEFGDTDVSGWPTHRIARLGLSYGPQEGALFADLSVGENLEAVHGTPRRREAVLHYFPVLGQRLRQLAGTLSGGEQKMLVLARALIPEPAILMLDEISAGLQPAMVASVKQALRQERRERGTTLLMVEQNLDLALDVADEVTVLKLGRVAVRARAESPDVRSSLIEALAP
jgi:branched-chain amino acid transport system ATP-binding protein